MLMIMIVNSHCVVRKQLFVQLFVDWVATPRMTLANHAIRVAGVSVGSAAPCGLCK
jgi:hypothetical protein